MQLIVNLPTVTGLHDLDEFVQAQLLLAVSPVFDELSTSNPPLTSYLLALGLEHYSCSAQTGRELCRQDLQRSRCHSPLRSTQMFLRTSYLREAEKFEKQ